MSTLANSYPISGNGSMQLTCTGAAADAATATRLRGVLRCWLQRHFSLTETRLNDMILAAYEALANAVQHAYRHDRWPRTVDMAARYEPVAGVLTVTITDHGRWLIPAPEPRQFRGLGVPLIRALTDAARIHGTATGTMVTLQWTNRVSSDFVEDSL